MTPDQTLITFWAIVGLMTGLLGTLMVGVIVALKTAPNWYLSDAVSEEASGQPNPLPVGQKPVMVASSSRLIALLGLLVILCLYLGLGYATLWDHFFNPSHPFDAKNVLTFLFGGATMFAPYLANQLGTAFGALTSSSPQTAANQSLAGPQTPIQPAPVQSVASIPGTAQPGLLPIQVQVPQQGPAQPQVGPPLPVQIPVLQVVAPQPQSGQLPAMQPPALPPSQGRELAIQPVAIPAPPGQQ